MLTWHVVDRVSQQFLEVLLALSSSHQPLPPQTAAFQHCGHSRRPHSHWTTDLRESEQKVTGWVLNASRQRLTHTAAAQATWTNRINVPEFGRPGDLEDFSQGRGTQQRTPPLFNHHEACVEACLDVELKSDSCLKVEAGGRSRRYHLKHSAHRPQATRPSASEEDLHALTLTNTNPGARLLNAAASSPPRSQPPSSCLFCTIEADHNRFLLFKQMRTGQGREPFKIREQIKLEVLDSAEEEAPGKQTLAMASNSIFESFSSFQPCFNRGEYHDEGLSTLLFAQRDDGEVLVCSVTEPCLLLTPPPSRGASAMWQIGSGSKRPAEAFDLLSAPLRITSEEREEDL
ncbi:hypothetical protein E1301_Tti021293 [Triplophysa tibetana]|uniref:Uncharacterized protein n=1 Tax=Triplophysa tibetana TaxID=1572043 RepID=A0A5A9PMA3_9TELE|nr:hypothetical protein E1301_Tti021293 [Triplophysa tibetana]